MRLPGKFPLPFRFLLLFLLLPGFAAAQRTVDVSGTVRDEMGKPIAGAHLSALSARTRQAVNAVSSADGTYSLSNLALGSHTVTVEASGYADRQIEITLTGSDDKAVLDVTLAHGSAEQGLPNAPKPNPPPPKEPSPESLGISFQQPQANPVLQARLQKRAAMLQLHQRLGLLTVLPMAASLVTGSIAQTSDSRVPNEAKLDLHLALGSATTVLYASSAYCAIFAPRGPGLQKRTVIRVHEALAFVHGPGMILTPILGAMAFRQQQSGQKVHGIATAHGAVATATAIAYGASILAVAWPIHLRFRL